MILDQIENSEVYEKISPAFSDAMTFLAAHRDGQIGADRVDLSEDAYILHKRYDTKEEAACHYEAHKDFIDVQFLISGSECIGWAPKKDLRERTYLVPKDQYLLEGEGTLIEMKPGQFMIFYPEDGHMPCVKYGESVLVEKLIAKIRVGR